MAETKKIRVLVADDHPLVRIGIRNALAAFGDIEIAGEAADGLEALRAVEEKKPDVALVDLAMPRMDGYQLIGRLKGIVPCVALTSSGDGEALEKAVECGAASVLMKSVGSSTIAQALRAAFRGEAFWESSAADLVLKAKTARLRKRDPFEELTPREREVLELIGRGLTNEEIADELGLSRKTVKVHVGNLLDKTGTSDRTKLAVLYWRTGSAERE